MTTTPTSNLADTIRNLGKQAREASLQMAVLETERKNDVLATLADLLIEKSSDIQDRNQLDLQRGEANGLSGALLDRLRLDNTRIRKMAAAVQDVIGLEDPVGEIIEEHQPENGLDIRKVRVPMGVIGIIYESRPNVTVDCAALCLKSGNAAILRGGSEAFESNSILSEIIREALKINHLNPDAVQFIPTPDREALNTLLKMDDYLSCIIPRGGEPLINYVSENSTVPVIKHYKGVCSIYVHRDADLDLAVRIVENAKCERPGVCNAIENLFIHKDLAETFLPEIAKKLSHEGVELRVDGETAQSVLSSEQIEFQPAVEDDFFEEFLDLILAVRLVDNLEAAVDAINHYGSAHSDAIITEDPDAAETFMNGVDSATVYWNASTRFTDGNEFGFGAEIGISTDRVHARGPMGLKELCTYKFKIYGQGQIRFQ